MSDDHRLQGDLLKEVRQITQETADQLADWFAQHPARPGHRVRVYGNPPTISLQLSLVAGHWLLEALEATTDVDSVATMVRDVAKSEVEDVVAIVRDLADPDFLVWSRFCDHEGPCLNYEGQDPDDYNGYDGETCYHHAAWAKARRERWDAVVNRALAWVAEHPTEETSDE